ncbi:unnamed protein product, partial [marine sediment metagenome]
PSDSEDGILVEGQQSHNVEVDHCIFGPETTGFTRDGIRHVTNQINRWHVHDNYFYVRGGGVGIHTTTALGCLFERNTFKVPDAGNGEAITILAAGGTDTCINNNWAASGIAALTFNPFRDVGGGQHWGLNYSGLVPTYPVNV